MDQQNNNSERIERYLTGQMNPDEEKAFMDDLKSDKALRHEAQMTAMMVSEMRQRQKQNDTEIINEVNALRPSHPWRKWIAWGASIAAVFVLFFGMRFYVSNYSADEPDYADCIALDSVDGSSHRDYSRHHEKLFRQYYSEPQLLASRGVGDDKVPKELDSLYRSVGSERNLAPVIARLRTIYDNTRANVKGYEEYRYYENDITWYLALAYLKDGHTDQARPLLQTLARDGNQEATDLLRELTP